jgi:protein-S-isoprenylcysteine O-methyltransferase Ste14
MSWGLKSFFAVVGFGFFLALAIRSIKMVAATGTISEPIALIGGAVVLIPVFAMAGWPIMIQIVKSNRSWPPEVIRAHGFLLLSLDVFLLVLAFGRGGGIPHVPLWCTLISLLPTHFPVLELACAAAALASAILGLVKPWPN